jgi:hypothetical protein
MLPLISEDLSRAVNKGALLFYSPEEADKQEWRSIVYSYRPIPIAYRCSPLGFTLCGILILTCAQAMYECDAGFWWRTVGVGLCLQGGLSYMADVHTWGRRDLCSRIWKSLDVLFAAALTSFCGPIVVYRMQLGIFVLDSDLRTLWLFAVTLALVSKILGAREARKDKDACCELLLLWHCGWHALPWTGSLLITVIALRASGGSPEMPVGSVTEL